MLSRYRGRKLKNKVLFSHGLDPISVLTIVRLQPRGNQMKSGVFLPPVP